MCNATNNKRLAEAAPNRPARTTKKKAPPLPLPLPLIHKAGTEVLYKNKTEGVLQPALVVEVHLDDVRPYYTIRLKDDGREKQTDDSRLRTMSLSFEREEFDSTNAETIITCNARTTTTTPAIEMIRITTQSGTAKFVPLYKAGTNVLYKNTAQGALQPARIVKVHLDDIEPYYTIKIAGDNNGGREKQTDNARLRLAAAALLEEEEEEEEEEELSVVTEKGANDEDRLLLSGEKKVKDEPEEGGALWSSSSPLCCINCFG